MVFCSQKVAYGFNNYSEYCLSDWSNGSELLFLSGELCFCLLYTSVIKDMDKAAELKEDTGCYFQVNASSAAGDQGLAVKNVVKKLLKMEMVDFVATDTHSDGNRAPRMKKCAAYLEKKLGTEAARKLLVENPGYILEDRLL